MYIYEDVDAREMQVKKIKMQRLDTGFEYGLSLCVYVMALTSMVKKNVQNKGKRDNLQIFYGNKMRHKKKRPWFEMFREYSVRRTVAIAKQ